MWTDVIAAICGLCAGCIIYLACSYSPPTNHFDERTIYDDDEYSND